MKRGINQVWKVTKRIITDVVGVLLILAAIFFGWLPGIGGIPLFLAGLGLLAIHNEWAQKLLQFSKDQGAKVYQKLFVDNPHLQIPYDILSATLTILCLCVLVFYDGIIGRTLAFFVLTVAILTFFANRKRLTRLLQIVNRKH